jgi:uncharacterized protein DUF5666
MKHASLAVCTVMVLTSTVWAHGGELHVMGTVTRVDKMSLTLRSTEGAVKTVMAMKETRVVKNGSAAKIEDVKVGDRVVIHAQEKGGLLQATEIKVANEIKRITHEH